MASKTRDARRAHRTRREEKSGPRLYSGLRPSFVFSAVVAIVTNLRLAPFIIAGNAVCRVEVFPYFHFIAATYLKHHYGRLYPGWKQIATLAVTF